MNCARCGKEIPDGDNKLCEDCQKSLLNEISSNENTDGNSKFKMAENGSEEKKKSTKKNKAKSAKRDSSGKEEGKKFTKKNVIEAIVFVVVIAILVILQLTTNIFSNIFVGKNTIGNTIGNIRNYGYSAYEKQWIFYVSPNADSSKICLNKVKNDGSKMQTILEADYDILSLNAVNGYLYFISIATSEADNLASTLPDDEKASLDYVNNKICRIKQDGSDLTVLNDNEFSNDCYEIYVIKDKIYYIGENYNIYKMDLDGNNKTQISKNKTGYLGMNEKYILYNDYPENSEELTQEEADNANYVTYIMNIDGTNAKPVNGERLYSVTIKDNYIYYTNKDKQICKIKIDGSDSKVICDTSAYNMNLSGDYIYYMNYKDESTSNYTVCIYRVKTDGTDNKIVKELNTYSTFINVLKSQVFYMDSENDNGKIGLINSDNLKEIELYSVSYSSLSSNNSEDKNTINNTVDSSDTNTAE